MFVRENLAFPKPESNFFLGIFNAIGTVADVAADVLATISIISPVWRKTGLALTTAKSPRMVPGAEASGLVAPRMAEEKEKRNHEHKLISKLI